jgi:hypothetical protein
MCARANWGLGGRGGGDLGRADTKCKQGEGGTQGNRHGSPLQGRYEEYRKKSPAEGKLGVCAQQTIAEVGKQTGKRQHNQTAVNHQRAGSEVQQEHRKHNQDTMHARGSQCKTLVTPSKPATNQSQQPRNTERPTQA